MAAGPAVKTAWAIVVSDQLKLTGPADCLAPVSRRQLAVDASEMRLNGVGGDVHLAGHLSGIQHARDVLQHLSLAFGERLDDQNRCLRWDGGRSGQLLAVRGRYQQAPVDARQFRVMLQGRLNPAALQDEREPELLTFSHPQRGGQGSVTAAGITAVVAELSVGQPRLQAHSLGRVIVGG